MKQERITFKVSFFLSERIKYAYWNELRETRRRAVGGGEMAGGLGDEVREAA